MRLKSQPKLNRHSYERLVKISDPNTPEYESTCVNFFSAIRTQNKIAESRTKFHKFWYRLGLHKIFEKFSQNSFFLKIHVKISTEFGTKRDKFQVKQMSIHLRKRTNSFAHKRTFLSALTVIKNLLPILWDESGLKSQPKLNRHSEERLVKISDQNTQGIRRGKSQIEREQNWFSENKTSWFFFLVSSFCDLFMDVHPYLGANNV